jgi:hypothetical protein
LSGALAHAAHAAHTADFNGNIIRLSIQTQNSETKLNQCASSRTNCAKKKVLNWESARYEGRIPKYQKLALGGEYLRF